jgi:MFS family permease
MSSTGRETEEKSITPGPPPNGGLVAWLQVAGSWCLMFNCWYVVFLARNSNLDVKTTLTYRNRGIVNTYGVFQEYYIEAFPSQTPSNIAWIGSIQAFLLMFFGALTGPLYDYGYFRTLLWVGSFLMVFGMMMTSLCTEYWQVVLSQGIVQGLGAGCLFIPSVAIIPTYFSTSMAFAIGVSGSGSGLGMCE